MFFSDSKLKNRAVVFLIILTAFLANAPGLKAPFQFDDEVDILERAAIKESPTAAAASAPFRAITYFTFGLDWKLGKGKPFQFHLTNLILHSFAVFLLFTFVSKIENKLAGAISAFWFAVHPLMASCVTYVSARAGLLSALFSFAVLILFFVRPCRGWQVLALVFFLFALFSKEDAVSLPLLMPMLAYLRGENPLKARKEISYTGFFFIVALVYGLVRVFSHEVVLGEGNGASYSRTLLLAPYVLSKALFMILLPSGMTADHYLNPIASLWEWRCWFPLFFWIAILSAAMKEMRKRSPWAFGLLWFAAALLPSTVTPLADPFAENRLYFACGGIALGIGMSAMKVSRKITGSSTKNFLFASGLAVMIVCLFFHNLHRQAVWNSKISLWGEAVRRAPEKTRALDNLALAFFDNGDLKKAQFIIEKSLKIDPTDAVAWNTLGLVLKEERNYSGALDAYEKALSLAPHLPKIRTNSANVLTSLGKYEEAIKRYEEALRGDPLDADAHYGIAFTYFMLKKYDLAREHILRALNLNPQDADARLLLIEIENMQNK